MRWSLIAVAAALALSAQAADKKEEAVGGDEEFISAPKLDRAVTCPGDGCTPELNAVAAKLVGLWQSDVTDFANAAEGDPRKGAADHVHVMRLAPNGAGVFDASPDYGGQWCRAAFDWAVELVGGGDVKLHRNFNENSTCKRTPPGVAKPVMVRFVQEVHKQPVPSGKLGFRFVSGTADWTDPVRMYYIKCGSNPVGESTECKPLDWRSDVDVGAKHTAADLPWKP